MESYCIFPELNAGRTYLWYFLVYSQMSESTRYAVWVDQGWGHKSQFLVWWSQCGTSQWKVSIM